MPLIRCYEMRRRRERRRQHPRGVPHGDPGVPSHLRGCMRVLAVCGASSPLMLFWGRNDLRGGKMSKDEFAAPRMRPAEGRGDAASRSLCRCPSLGLAAGFQPPPHSWRRLTGKSRISSSAATEKCCLSAGDGPGRSRWGGNPGGDANRCWAKPGLALCLRAPSPCPLPAPG